MILKKKVNLVTLKEVNTLTQVLHNVEKGKCFGSERGEYNEL